VSPEVEVTLPSTPALATRQTRSTVLAGIIIVALGLIAYSSSLQAGFIWDDDRYVTGNSFLRSVEGLGAIWAKPGATPQYYPLVFTSFWLEYHLWELDPFGYHLSNVLLHLLNALLLWQILRFLSVPGAWLAAAVFALHPVHVESVAWITERKNVLSAAFYLLALYSYMSFDPEGFSTKSVDSGPRDDPQSVHPRRWLLYLASIASFLLALLSKTVTCSLPAAILLLLWWRSGRIRRSDWVRMTPFFLAGIIFSIVTVAVERHVEGAVGPQWELSFLQRVLIAGRALWFYVEKLVLPHRLTFIYPRWEVDLSVWRHYLFPLLALLALALLWVRRRSIGRGPVVCALFFAGALFPALGFIDFYPMKYSFVADHFQYLASIGIIVLLVGSATAFVRGSSGFVRLVATNLAVLMLMVLVVLTWRQGRIYEDTEVLWKDTIAKNPGCWMAHNNLGALYQQSGQTGRAFFHFREALRIKPEHAGAHSNLAIVWCGQRKWEEGEYHFQQALRLDPSIPGVHYNYGVCLQLQDRMKEAIDAFTKAIRRRPTYVQAHYNVAAVLIDQGRTSEAMEHLERVVTLDPLFVPAYHQMGIALASQGRFEDAVRQYREAIRLDPEYAQAHAELAEAYYHLREYDLARKHLRTSTELGLPPDEDFLRQLSDDALPSHR